MKKLYSAEVKVYSRTDTYSWKEYLERRECQILTESYKNNVWKPLFYNPETCCSNLIAFKNQCNTFKEYEVTDEVFRDLGGIDKEGFRLKLEFSEIPF